MSDELPIFEFEKDFARSLRCIPMAVRYKLDHAGIKLSLRQWCRFNHDDRSQLLTLPCRSTDEIKFYKEKLIELIAVRAHEQAKEVALDMAPEWNDVAAVPQRVCSHAKSLALSPPTQEQWAGLLPLQRFALLKLTRESHDNANFTPAMREFGILQS
ncbi:MAG: nitrate reductase associated protein [Steroidobacteraceae bacterium]